MCFYRKKITLVPFSYAKNVKGLQVTSNTTSASGKPGKGLPVQKISLVLMNIMTIGEMYNILIQRVPIN